MSLSGPEHVKSVSDLNRFNFTVLTCALFLLYTVARGLHVRAELIAYKERSASRQICVALIAVLMVELECKPSAADGPQQHPHRFEAVRLRRVGMRANFRLQIIPAAAHEEDPRQKSVRFGNCEIFRWAAVDESHE
ncbi:hypothetical protein Tsp_12721 [Trichinella spiralis]|uniref:hypothetical protein n=1 Tax=Trichinella spiralis TaxID=6334 RepID=UPI0001EFED40|nr:hypothetical protein Tsp_12721 [Trichinella spiralis]